MPVDILKQIRDFWNNLSKKVKTYILMSIAGIVLISVLATVILNIKSYEVLFSGLSSTEQSQIVSRLGELGIDFKTEVGGIIRVPSDNVASLKMQLSSEGYPKSTLTYDLFQSSTDFMTTDFDKKQYLIFQLQDRLQESIKTIDGVKNAIVNLSIADASSYVLESDKVPSTASLVLNLESSVSLTNKQIKGIENLIAKSVPGLTASNVSIIDSEGNILNNSSSSSGISLENVEMEKQASEIYKSKIVELLEPLYGAKGMSIAVNVSLDFSKKTSDQIQYTPSETKTGTSETNNTETTTSNKNSMVNQIQSQIVNNGGEVKDITASIIINKTLSDADKASVNKIVANSIGVSTDKVIVTDMEFTAANELTKKAIDALSQKPSFWDQYMYIIIPAAGAVVFLPLLAFLFLSSRRRRKGRVTSYQYEEIKGTVRPGTNTNRKPIAQPVQTEEVPAIVLNETREQGLKRQIKEFSNSNPDIVAQLIRTWLKEGE